MAGWIDDDQLLTLAEPLAKSGYGDYLVGLVDLDRPARDAAGPADVDHPGFPVSQRR